MVYFRKMVDHDNQMTRLRQGRQSQTMLARRECEQRERAQREQMEQLDIASSSALRWRSRLHEASSSRAHEEEVLEMEVPEVESPAEEAQDAENAEVPDDDVEELAVAEDAGYPGGPYDRSLLIYYGDHTSRYVWGEEVL